MVGVSKYFIKTIEEVVMTIIIMMMIMIITVVVILLGQRMYVKMTMLVFEMANKQDY